MPQRPSLVPAGICVEPLRRGPGSPDIEPWPGAACHTDGAAPRQIAWIPGCLGILPPNGASTLAEAREVSPVDWQQWYRDRRVLILGAGGFLGRHLSRALAACQARLTLSATTAHSFPYLLPPSERLTRIVCTSMPTGSMDMSINISSVRVAR